MSRKNSDLYEQEMQKALHKILYNIQRLKKYRSSEMSINSNDEEEKNKMEEIVEESVEPLETKKELEESGIEVSQVKVQLNKRRQLPRIPRTRSESW